MPFFAARRAREVQDKGTTRRFLYPPPRNVSAFLTESKQAKRELGECLKQPKS